MKVKSILILISLVAYCSANLRFLGSESYDLIVNGNFEEPKFEGEKKTFDKIPGWQISSPMTIGVGSTFFYAWDQTRVASLDNGENIQLSQEINLKSEDSLCFLSFKYAPRNNDSSGISVLLNGIEIFTDICPNDRVSREGLEVLLKKGNNKLTFIGIGESDGVGVTLSNVSLVCDLTFNEPLPSPEPKPKPQPKPEPKPQPKPQPKPEPIPSPSTDNKNNKKDDKDNKNDNNNKKKEDEYDVIVKKTAKQVFPDLIVDVKPKNPKSKNFKNFEFDIQLRLGHKKDFLKK